VHQQLIDTLRRIEEGATEAAHRATVKVESNERQLITFQRDLLGVIADLQTSSNKSNEMQAKSNDMLEKATTQLTSNTATLREVLGVVNNLTRLVAEMSKKRKRKPAKRAPAKAKRRKR
jgi:hypothetical protein